MLKYMRGANFDEKGKALRRLDPKHYYITKNAAKELFAAKNGFVFDIL